MNIVPFQYSYSKKKAEGIRGNLFFFSPLDTSTKSDYNISSSTKSDLKFKVRFLVHTFYRIYRKGQCPMNTPSKPYISKAQAEYNHLYKELEDLYHDVSLNAKLADSVFDIFYGIFELGDGCLQRDICQTSFLSKQTINSAIRKMEQNGWIRLIPGKGRSMQIFLTDSGQNIMQEKIYPIVDAENAAIATLTPEECRQMLLLHRKYAAALKNEFSKICRKDL